MAHRVNLPALIVHGGAGGRAAIDERPGRQRGLLAAVEAGARILRDGGDALDTVCAAVTMLENDPLFNAGYGSCLTSDGHVEMDAGVATARRANTSPGGRRRFEICAGGVVLVSRVRNPILLARAVMERTPHLLMGGGGVERLARDAGLRLCRPASMVAPRALKRWQAAQRDTQADVQHGTVGAVAIDRAGNFAAATSTGGVAGKLPGRIGDSAILGAGLYANERGASSATGHGEAILRAALSREAVERLRAMPAQRVAELVIARMARYAQGEAGIIVVDASGRFGFAHNAAAMEIATFAPTAGSRHLLAPRIGVV
jgi:beta-aspartyl-peptidase (threonine type)